MLPRTASRPVCLAAAVLLTAAAGGAATAGPGGGTRSLEPTAQLAADGGATAPAPGTGGGMAAPPAPPPEPAPQEESTPSPEAAPAPAAPEEAAPDQTAASDDPAPEPPTTGDAGDAAPVETLEEPDEPQRDPDADPDPPAAEEALGAEGAPLVPAEVLPVDVDEASGAPLIDINPAHTAAEPLRTQPDLAAARAAQEDGQEDPNGEQDPDGQQEEDDEVIIPVPIDGVDDDETDQGPAEPAPTPVARGRTPGLPSTGRELVGPAGSAVLLLLAGAALRLAVAPTGAPARA